MIGFVGVYGVLGLGGLGFRVRVLSLGLRCRLYGLMGVYGFRVQGFGLRFWAWVWVRDGSVG